jgi:CRP-like cAMP-binding protein
MEQLADFLNQIYPLKEAELEAFLSKWKPVSFKRKELITRAGQTEKYLYFVEEGIQRSYYVKEDKEHVIAFVYAPSFSGIPESFIPQEPSKYFLESITDCKMLRLSHHDLQKLMDEHRGIERLFRKFTEEILINFIHRHYELLSHTIEERFIAFCKRSPHLLGMVPHKYIASYLGIDPTNFSKLLGKIKI